MENATAEFFNLVLYAEITDVRARLQRDTSLARLTDENGFTALHVLMTEDRPNVAQLLIDAGAQVSARNHKHMTPLHLAQHRSLVKVLVKYGADVNARASDNSTPLHIAAAEGEDTGSMEVIHALLDAEADASLTDEDGATPKQIAAARGEDEKVALFEGFAKA